MTIRELIQILEKCNPDSYVKVVDRNCGEEIGELMSVDKDGNLEVEPR